MQTENKAKLELKHVVPYLPYGLKIATAHGTYTLSGLTQSEYIIASNSRIYHDGALPILRPLSDLTKLVDFDGIEINTIEALKTIYNALNSTELTELSFYHTPEDGFCLFGIANEYEDVKEIAMPMYMYQCVFEKHFDIFGLIDQGLAIDINTLK